ncbi:MAG: glycosyltransferase family 2 protein [Acidimicrobiales bacterium]|nr:glycosyltransferase family 2 protein [Acidimicrobiales bacterium]
MTTGTAPDDTITQQATPDVTIGFLARERFELGAESLASLYEKTTLPFRLLLVDAATPPRYWQAMLQVLDGHDNWQVLRHDQHLLPAAAKNLILRHAKTEYVCLLENDNIFNDGWLEALLDACESASADVAVPLVREGRGDHGHFDHHLGSLVPAGDGLWRVDPEERPRNRITERQPVTFVEQHCLLFRRSVFDRIGPYDEELNTRDEVDLSLALHHAEATVILEPSAVVNYVPPSSPPADDELPYYRMRWDLDRAEASRERIRDRWSLVDTPGDLGFVKYRNQIPDLPVARARIEELCAVGTNVVVVENGDWFGTGLIDDLPVQPFPDVDGYFGGFPASDHEAIEHLTQIRRHGTVTFAVGWPARWWFDFLPEFKAHLDAEATTVVEGRLLDIYTLPEPTS